MNEATPKPINDADRFKWLEETQSLLNFSDKGPHVCVGSDGENDHYYGNTYREAIDNAMEGWLLKKAEAGVKSMRPEEDDIMHRLYHRLAPLAFMPTEVSKEEASRLGYPYVRLSDVEAAIRDELFKCPA